MKKLVEINGMHCEKCKARVENALNSIDGVKAKINLAKKTATLDIKGDVADETITSAITALGFEVVGITAKKGIFG